MTFRLALRALASRPVRSAVLAGGFGLGIGVMANLLGIGEVILEQAESPSLVGGGDVVVWGERGRVENARFLLTGVLGGGPLGERVAAASPTDSAPLYLVRDERVVRLRGRGGVPSLEKALGDRETAAFEAWTDDEADADWAAPDPADVLRSMDRFHPVPEDTPWSDSWAEWLYFNGRAGGARFYLTFLVGPRLGDGRRGAGVRLQLERDGRTTAFFDRGEVAEDEVLSTAPDLEIGGSRVRLRGLRYRISLALYDDDDETRSRPVALAGDIELEAVPGRSMPPLELRGVGGWVSGYVVPVLSGRLDGALRVHGETLSLTGGTGYHDHNWGFWEGVSWQWGQVMGEDLSIVYGRVRPPAEVADPERVPSVLAAFGPDGPLGFAVNVAIEETNDPDTGRPRTISVRGRGEGLDLRMRLVADSAVRTRMRRGMFGAGMDFFQLRGEFRVGGRVGERSVEFSGPGSAETFRVPE